MHVTSSISYVLFLCKAEGAEEACWSLLEKLSVLNHEPILAYGIWFCALFLCH